jgi:hypothetical protein
MARAFDAELLAWLREVPPQLALERLGLYVAVDRDFVPMKDARTERWIVSLPAGELELLITGPKWYDTRAGKGGGGAIDLLMHLEGLDFVAAVKRLSVAVGRRPPL